MQPGLEHGLHVDVRHQQVFVELAGHGQPFAALAQDHAAAIEHELVLAADLVDVTYGDGVVCGARGQHVLPHGVLAHGVGRGVEVDRNLRPGQSLRLQRIAGIPDVFADADADEGAADAVDLVTLALLEVAVFIEHAVVRQVVLVVHVDEGTVVNDGGGVVDIVRRIDEADDGGDAAAPVQDALERR